ncbi:MAG TPA: hypothetical protein VMF69_20045 [Gemmataceae bacterium]|nr:hypothetical protein [Gemmataceae bacterium]
MAEHLYGVARVCCLIGKIILLAVLVTWVTAAPLVWILRDGLGPDMVETSGLKAAFKFLVCWGVPALAISVPLVGLSLIERRCQPAHGDRQKDKTSP